MEPWFEGVFFFPGGAKPNSAGIILSCGIHGDETRPIELLDELKRAILGADLNLKPPLLLIYGNPPAIRQSRRYIDFNLNRLFGPSTFTGPEAERAVQLMQACAQFHSRVGKIDCHLDLHSTIKPSLIERFALRPVGSQPMPLQWQHHLNQAGFGALVYQTRPANTFSQFTHDRFNCESLTLECGSHSQGNNTQGNDSDLMQWLRALVSDETLHHAPATAANASLSLFEVQEEIVRSSESFQFLIAEDEPNFSGHPAGTPLYQDQSGVKRLQEECYTLFLNSRVQIGQRAGLLLKSI